MEKIITRTSPRNDIMRDKVMDNTVFHRKFRNAGINDRLDGIIMENLVQIVKGLNPSMVIQVLVAKWRTLPWGVLKILDNKSRVIWISFPLT